MKCSKCKKEVDSRYGWPIGWSWVQYSWFEEEGPDLKLNLERPYYLLCQTCKEEIFAGLQPYKTVIKQEVVPV